jgi:hypothetical protein
MSTETVISLMSVAVTLSTVLVTANLNRKSARLKHLLDNVYEDHKRLRANLGDILRDGEYSFLCVPDELTEEDIQITNTDYDNYKKKYDKNPYSKYEKFIKMPSVYGDLFGRFTEMILLDLRTVSDQSTPRVQKLAFEVVNLYEEVLNKKEEYLYSLECADIGIDPSNYGVTESFIDSTDRARKKIFLVKAKKLLLKLEKEIGKVVKL